MRILALALVLALAAAGAGCIQVQVGAPQEPSPSAPSSASSTGPAKAGTLKAEFSWSPNPPKVGQAVRFEGRAEGLGGHRVDAWSWDFGDNGTARTQAPSHTFRAAGERLVTLRLMADDGRIAQVAHRVFVVNAPAPGGGGSGPSGNQSGGGSAPPGPPPTPGVFDCGGTTVHEPNDTFGRDGSGLAWAALKTGFRLAVAWPTEAPTVETLRYRVGAGAEQTLTETVPRTLHLFVIDGLPEGSWACFNAGDRPAHGVRLANAMTAYQPPAGNATATGPGAHGVYTTSFLVLVNEGGDVAEVEAGLQRYAEMLWDATDGWVRAGALLVAVGDVHHHDSGWAACYVLGLASPACSGAFDVIVTEDAVPQGAASTYRRGVTDPDAAIWMNMHWQAVPGPLSLDDFGSVLVHEAGHYLFDMADLYGDPVVPDSQECDIPALSISIMGGGRETTEFDDALHPCPSQGSGYVPSWTLMRGQFPEIPERAAIDAGPSGTGGVAFTQVYTGP